MPSIRICVYSVLWSIWCYVAVFLACTEVIMTAVRELVLVNITVDTAMPENETLII